MVSLLPLYIKHIVCEVVILIDDKVELVPGSFCLQSHNIELTRCRILAMYALNGPGTIEALIRVYEIVYHSTTILIEVLIQVLQVAAHHREVEVQDLKLSLLRSWVISDIHTLEQLLEVVLLIDVVVSLEHVEEQALAEAARTDEKKEVSSILHSLEEHSLVDQIKILLPNLPEISNAVRNTLECRAHDAINLVSNANLHKIPEIVLYSYKKVE